MNLTVVALFLAAISLHGQTRQFHDGEVLKVPGATVTIRDPTGNQICATFSPAGILTSPGVHITSAATCSTPPPGFFEVTVTDLDVDYIEITVGIVEGLGGDVAIQGDTVFQRILRFHTYTSPANPGLHWSIGEIIDLSKIRTINIKLLKVKTQEMFR